MASNDNDSAFRDIAAQLSADSRFARRFANREARLSGRGVLLPRACTACLAAAGLGCLAAALCSGLLFLIAPCVLALAGSARLARPDLCRRDRRRDRAAPLALDGAIVVGCDRSPRGDAALRYAASEAVRRNLRLVIVSSYLRSVDPGVADAEAANSVPRERAASDTRLAFCRALNTSEALLPPHEIVIDRGPAARVLRRYGGAVLVVLGADQRNRLARLLIAPPVPGRIARRVQAPVVVVPSAWQRGTPPR